MSDRDEIAEVLAEHARKSGIRDKRHHCMCGWVGERGGHGAHLAAVLEAEVIRPREAEAGARALEEAADEGPLHFAMTHREPKWRGYNHLVTTDWLRARAADLRGGGEG